tara:strand:- start:599 stop:742 length:144 start_codon:yes stop_codon:yes gene_type:complete
MEITKPNPIKIDTPKVVMILITSYEDIAPPIVGGIGVMVVGSTNIVG